MKKSDLRSGMIVEYRDGIKRLVVNDDLIGDDGHLSLSNYNDDLKHDEYSDLDIIKVYRYKRVRSFSYLLKDDNLELISERKEQKIQLTKEQIKILKALKTLGFNWIARDKDDDLYAYNTKPKKLIYSWSIGSSATLLDFLTVEFDFIKWSDDEPTNIDELLKENRK